jgi:hypothetical protein
VREGVVVFVGILVEVRTVVTVGEMVDIEIVPEAAVKAVGGLV